MEVPRLSVLHLLEMMEVQRVFLLRPYLLSLGNPFGTELKRRRRVASYKAYTVEGRIKFSLRSGVRWIKNKYLDIRYGWW
ncbi:hypothetical protein KP509_15G001400 [Ceratopteris richardii]|uniref:Uncharacterized protein n=1 Tax=Ceratopteris richardii TaxID=49495 RepID=A0A8T2T2G2_CERRI|nr:hypothetical protein KP509_15G001400 [Ceratopteris richardii]